MMDPNETNAANENSTLEEASQEVVAEMANEPAAKQTNEPSAAQYATKAEIVNRLKEIVQNVENVDKSELDLLKQTFYKLHHISSEKARKEFIDQGGDAESYTPEVDEDEIAYKAEMELIKERRNALYQEQEQQKTDNLAKKQAIIDKIKQLLETPEEANKAYQEVKQMQQEWKNIGSVPPEKANELWKNYQLYTEQYYDILKMNNEFREYDFKKNLEIKTHLCESAEKLTEESDVISAFHQLQKLHQEFRDCGPVAKELREDVWKRFKNASTIINKRHQQHFESIKEQELKNLELKTTLCEQVEQIDTVNIKSASQWNEVTQQIIDIQAQWKTIGFAPQKMNVKVFERFRQACDTFFTAKSEFYKSLKNSFTENLKKKTELCEKAEALKESKDWKKTSDILVQLQKEWKTIGPVAKKESDAVWKRFVSACDHFFEEKNKSSFGQRHEEMDNLKKKKNIIDQLKAIQTQEPTNDTQQQVRDLMKTWNEVGHVPFKEKDALYEEYHSIIDTLFKELNIHTSQKRLNKFKSAIKERSGQEGNSLTRERERMYRAYENMKNELQTYENNLGFLTSKSKKGNGLVTEINRKVEKLKDELELLKQKIIAVDEQLNDASKE